MVLSYPVSGRSVLSQVSRGRDSIERACGLVLCHLNRTRSSILATVGQPCETGAKQGWVRSNDARPLPPRRAALASRMGLDTKKNHSNVILVILVIYMLFHSTLYSIHHLYAVAIDLHSSRLRSSLPLLQYELSPIP